MDCKGGSHMIAEVVVDVATQKSGTQNELGVGCPCMLKHCQGIIFIFIFRKSWG